MSPRWHTSTFALPAGVHSHASAAPDAALSPGHSLIAKHTYSCSNNREASQVHCGYTMSCCLTSWVCTQLCSVKHSCRTQIGSASSYLVSHVIYHNMCATMSTVAPICATPITSAKNMQATCLYINSLIKHCGAPGLTPHHLLS